MNFILSSQLFWKSKTIVKIKLIKNIRSGKSQINTSEYVLYKFFLKITELNLF